MGVKDPRVLSRDPKQIRNRIRQARVPIDRDVQMYIDEVWKKPLEEWDLEELARGRPRNDRGKFGGPVPEWITPYVVKEAKRRLLDHTLGALAGHVELALQTLVKLLKDSSVDDFGRPMVDSKTKLEAIKFIIENVVGKPKAVLEVDATDTVRQFLAAALVMDDSDRAPVYEIEGAVIEEEEDDDDAE